MARTAAARRGRPSTKDDKSVKSASPRSATPSKKAPRSASVGKKSATPRATPAVLTVNAATALVESLPSVEAAVNIVAPPSPIAESMEERSQFAELLGAVGAASALAVVGYYQMAPDPPFLTSLQLGTLSIVPTAVLGYVTFIHNRTGGLLQSGGYSVAVLLAILSMVLKSVLALLGAGEITFALISLLVATVVAYAFERADNTYPVGVGAAAAFLALFLAYDVWFAGAAQWTSALASIYVPTVTAFPAIVPKAVRILSTATAAVACGRAWGSWTAGGAHTIKLAAAAIAAVLLTVQFSHVATALEQTGLQTASVAALVDWTAVYLLAFSSQ